MPRPQRAQHHLMAAAGVAERTDRNRSVELFRMRLEPANRQVHVADRSGIARLGRLAEIDGSDENALARQRSVYARVIRPIAVVPRPAVHIDDGREWPRSFGLINSSQ